MQAEVACFENLEVASERLRRGLLCIITEEMEPKETQVWP